MFKGLNTILALTLLCILNNSYGQTPKVVDKVVAVIGKQTILLSDIENQVLQLRAQGYYTSGDIRCEVLEEMLYNKLLVNQAILDSVEVGEAEINSELERRLNYFINQIGSEEKLEEYYKKTIPEIKEEFREVIKEQMLAQRMQGKVTADLKVTPQEVRSFYKSLPEDSLPVVNTKFEIGQIMIKPKVQEAEILRITDQLRSFKDRVAKGESFSTLAVLYSEDPGSARKGGELGFVSRNDLVPEFSAVAFNLKVGEVSKVVKTDYGYHIIQLIEVKGERINCRHILLKPRIAPEEKVKARQKLDSVRTLINNKTLGFKEACWQYSDDEDTRMNGGVMLNPYTGNSWFEASELEPKIAYAIRDLETGQVSAPFEADDANGRSVFKIVMLREKTEPHPANLNDDYQLIQDKALEKKQNDFMQEWVTQIVKKTYIRIDDDYKKCSFDNKAWNF